MARGSTGMSALYDELVKLDKPIADRWKARLRGDPKRTLGPADADAILKPLMQPDRTISDAETRAIAKMVTWGEWTPEALAVIRVIVRVGVEGGLFQSGGEIFVSPEKLRPVSSALGAGMTGKIAFKSPRYQLLLRPGALPGPSSSSSASPRSSCSRSACTASRSSRG